MKRTLLLSLALGLSPLAALALPAVGDVVGTNADDASKAFEAAGCPVSDFEVEDGKIEAKCTETATGKNWEFYIDPATGAIAEVKANDD